jgi:hypothetical protein
MFGQIVCRRSILAMLAAPLASCSSKAAKFSFEAASGAPPPTRIERLLLWVPAGFAAGADTKQVINAFSAKLGRFGVAVKVGQSSRLELDRSDAQRPFMETFKPTHILEVIRLSGVLENGRVVDMFSATSFRAQLFDAGSHRWLRTYTYGGSGDPGPLFVDEVLNQLRADGYL